MNFSKRDISGKKIEKIQAILHYAKHLELYEKSGVMAAPAHNITKDCRMRLLNMLFSDKHCAKIGNRPSRADLDEGKVAENSDFWQGIAEDWVNPDAYNQLVQASPWFNEENDASD